MSVRWSKNDTIREIAGRYVNKCLSSGVDAIMFDGYNPSTKDVIANTRCEKSVKGSVDASCFLIRILKIEYRDSRLFTCYFRPV